MGNLVGSILEPFTGAKATRRAADAAANQQAEAARISAIASAFRPVGMTTRFGSSNFQIETDPETGLPRVTSAGYQVSPELAALQDRLTALGAGALGTAEAAPGIAQMYGTQAQGLFGLGQQFLPTSAETQASPEAQAYAAQLRQLGGSLIGDMSTQAGQDVMAQQARLQALAQQITPTSYDTTGRAKELYGQQQALLQPGRQQEEQRLGASVFGRGRAGLNISGQGQPELYALSKAREEQNAALAVGAQEQARQQLQQDIGLGANLGQQAIATGQQGQQYQLGLLGQGLGYMGQGLSTQQQAEEIARQQMLQNLSTGTQLFGTAGSLLGQQYSIPTQALAPLQTYLGTLANVEELGQQPFNLGMQLGGAVTQGGQAGGSLLNAGLSQAANTRFQGVQAANAANAQFLSGLMQAGTTAYGGSQGWFKR